MMTREAVVLLVDGDAELREQMARSLSERTECTDSNHMMHAADGRAALVLARTRRPDLIVTALEIAIVDGAEMLTQLRQDASLHDVPVLLVSGRADLSQVAAVHGANAHLAKPFSADDLIRTVKTICRVAEASNQNVGPASVETRFQTPMSPAREPIIARDVPRSAT